MKKILNIIILFAAVVFCGCSDFDDSELRGRIDGYKNRIEALKAKAETLGKQLADLSYLTNGNVITTVSQDADGKYVVTYKDNKDVEHTVVLATMDDIVDVPIIGVKLDENGVYYWTKCIDGEITWLTDDDGEKFPVSGYTPTISVDADGCWTVDGVQILDASGNPIKATTDATSVFRSAELDGDGNFSLTLGDGSTITLRVFNSLNLKLDAMPVTTVADPSKSITVSYELSGEAKETAIVAVAKAEGLDAVIDRDAKTVTVSFDASFSRGTVIVMAYDLADNVIVKPLFYKAATLGTVAISTPDQLVAFAAAVNAGGEEAAAKAVLTQDIDMKDVAWTPIGNGAYTTANAMTGPAFQGTFDGQSHAVRNLKIVVPADAAAGSAWGLFGVLKGATVRNLTIGEGSSVVSTAAAMTAVGAVAGYAYEATIENCENRAAIDIQGGGDNVRESAGGIVGAICANENDSHILSCTNYGKITSKNSVNTKNGATGFSIGGIVGFADASTTTERYNNVVGCVNEGAIDAQATRTAGVVATMNKYTKLENCANNAAVTCSDVTASNSRVAGIVSAMGGHTYLTSCVNNGTVAFAVAGDTTHGYAAGIAGQTNDNNTAIDGCENYGAVLSDIINAAANKYIGIVCANTNKKTIAIRNCKIGGRIGPFSDGQQGATEITEQNFEQYIYFTLTGGGVPTLENNSFSGGPAKPGIATVEDLTAFRDAVNAGESTAQWEDAGGVVSLLGDIDMKDVAGWTPIGNASYKWEKNLLTIEGNAFKGTFDGQGYALKNLKLAYGGSAANTAYGLFGVLDGATVRNLTVGTALGDASALKVTASGGTAEVGVIAGVCRDANVSDCVNYAKIEYDGTSAARVSAAMVGFIFSETEGTKLERLQNYGAVEADTHGNSTNGGNTAIHMAGICGFATGNATNKICNDIAYCDNYGNITSNSARSSGIVAAANTYTRINSCVNHGNQLNTCGTTGRLGNITCLHQQRQSRLDGRRPLRRSAQSGQPCDQLVQRLRQLRRDRHRRRQPRRVLRLQRLCDQLDQLHRGRQGRGLQRRNHGLRFVRRERAGALSGRAEGHRSDQRGQHYLPDRFEFGRFGRRRRCGADAAHSLHRQQLYQGRRRAPAENGLGRRHSDAEDGASLLRRSYDSRICRRLCDQVRLYLLQVQPRHFALALLHRIQHSADRQVGYVGHRLPAGTYGQQLRLDMERHREKRHSGVDRRHQGRPERTYAQVRLYHVAGLFQYGQDRYGAASLQEFHDAGRDVRRDRGAGPQGARPDRRGADHSHRDGAAEPAHLAAQQRHGPHARRLSHGLRPEPLCRGLRRLRVDHLAFVRRQETRRQQLPLQRVEYGGRHLYDARDRRQSAGCAAGGALRPCHALCRDRHVARHPDARQRDRGHRF
jgi:hypothetical protein